MKKIEKFKNAHTIMFCITAEILWIACLNLLRIGLNNVLPSENQFIVKIIQETLIIAISLLMFKAAGKLDVLSRKGSGIRKGLLIGIFPLIINFISGALELIKFSGVRTYQPLPSIIFFILSVFFIGMAEEFMFRGFIGTILIEKYGTNRKGILKAAVITAVLFGCAHLSNLLTSAPIGVLIQVIAAAFGGLLLTAVYYRSGSIWTVVILHGCTDLVGGLIGGLYGIKLSSTISNYKPINLVPSIISLIIAIFLLRKKELGNEII